MLYAFTLTENLIKEEVSVKLEEGWQLGDLYRVGHPFIGGVHGSLILLIMILK